MDIFQEADPVVRAKGSPSYETKIFYFKIKQLWNDASNINNT